MNTSSSQKDAGRVRIHRVTFTSVYRGILPIASSYHKSMIHKNPFGCNDSCLTQHIITCRAVVPLLLQEYRRVFSTSHYHHNTHHCKIQVIIHWKLKLLRAMPIRHCHVNQDYSQMSHIARTHCRFSRVLVSFDATVQNRVTSIMTMQGILKLINIQSNVAR